MEKKMTTRISKKEEILDVAESMIRTSGYNGFSTRDIAISVGIKAASVHYHFPKKSDIGVAVTERYTEHFIQSLGEPASFKDKQHAPLATYIQVFRNALIKDRKLCLCAVLGAETGGLPLDITAKTKIFFERNMEWLRSSFIAAFDIPAKAAQKKAALVLSSLEGGLILSTSMQDDQLFEDVADSLIELMSLK